MKLRRMLTRLGVVAAATATTLAISTTPAFAIWDGIIVATDAGDNVGRLDWNPPTGNGYYCSATLVEPDVAMTAEHCVKGPSSWSELSVKFGTRNRDSDPGTTATVVSVTASTRDYRGTRDSIVLLKLDRSISDVVPARVAKAGTSNKLYAKGTSVWAIGWGTINPSQSVASSELRLATMVVADPTSTTNGGAIRVGETGGGRPQHGDSGGPLFTYDDEGPIVVGVYTGSGTRKGNNHFYMKTAIDPLFAS